MGFVTVPLMPIAQVSMFGLFVNMVLMLVCGLAPFKQYTIPKLEFVVMLLSKLIVTVKEAVEDYRLLEL